MARPAVGFVGFLQGLAFVGVHGSLGGGGVGFLGTAGWAAVGEAGFVRFELEFF